VEPPTYDNTTCFDDLLSPRKRRTSTIKGTGHPIGPKNGPAPCKSSAIICRASELTRAVPNHNTTTPFDDSLYAENMVQLRNVTPAAATTPTPGFTNPNNASTSTSYATPPCLSSDTAIMTDALDPPCSPPPVYSAAPMKGWMTQGHAGTSAHVDHHSTKYSEVTVDANPSVAEKATGRNFATSGGSINTVEAWAHEYRRDDAVPELQGDTVSFSATNLGPVNPFELFAGPTPTKSRPIATSAATEPTCINRLSEVMGDLSFAAELPANNPGPGPPPGYPPISKNLAISELSTGIPKRRPLPSRAITSPLAAVHELPVQHQPEQYAPLSVRMPSSATFSGLEVARNAHEYPQSSSQWTSTGRHNSAPSVSSQPMGLVSSAPSPLSTPIMGNATHFAFNQHVVSPLITPTVPVAQSLRSDLQRTESTASSRMQRQKSFLDMLGAIDQS
jgi:hypothetical protein